MGLVSEKLSGCRGRLVHTWNTGRDSELEQRSGWIELWPEKLSQGNLWQVHKEGRPGQGTGSEDHSGWGGSCTSTLTHHTAELVFTRWTLAFSPWGAILRLVAAVCSSAESGVWVTSTLTLACWEESVRGDSHWNTQRHHQGTALLVFTRVLQKSCEEINPVCLVEKDCKNH